MKEYQSYLLKLQIGTKDVDIDGVIFAGPYYIFFKWS